MKNSYLKNICLAVCTLLLLSFAGKTLTAQNQEKKADLKTYIYLRNAINFTKSTSEFYKASYLQAKKQGLTAYSEKFESLARSEEDQYIRFKVLANALGISFTEQKAAYPLMSTIENLKKAGSLQQFESKIYREAIKTSKQENLQTALEAFNNSEASIKANKAEIKELSNNLERQ